jgi:hypothetical protein
VNVRKWATPLTAGSFVLVGVTGLLMFFEVRLGWITPVHEWFSLLFVAGALLHVWMHRNPMMAHLRRPWVGALVGAFALVVVLALVLPSPGGRGRGGEGRHRLARSAVPVLLQARIGTLADLTHRSPQALRIELARQGVHDASDSTTLEAAARKSGVEPMRVLAAILGPSEDED